MQSLALVIFLNVSFLAIIGCFQKYYHQNTDGYLEILGIWNAQNQDITLVHLAIRITGHALRLFRCLLGFILHTKQSLNLIQA